MHFITEPWDAVLREATSEDKAIFLQLETNDCRQCNDVANRAFADPAIGKFFAGRFLATRVDGKSAEGKMLANRYEVTTFPVSLFLDAKGNILYRYNGSVSMPSYYINFAKKALSRKGNSSFYSMDSLYRAGERNTVFLEKYIQIRDSLNMPVDDVLDTLAVNLPADSARSVSTVKFIAKHAPIIGSAAFDYMYKDYPTLRAAYHDIPQAGIINDDIIVKSRKLAIKEKNITLAKQAAEFASNTWGEDLWNARKGFLLNMKEYYKGVGDTISYLPLAVEYYDTYFIPLSIDSLKKARDKMFQTALSKVQGDTNWIDGKVFTVKKIMRTPPGYITYSNELNDGAWSFYQMTRDTTLLKKALNWSWHSIQYYDMPAYQDTYAHLLYALGQKDKAIQWEKKALNNAKSHNMILKDYEAALAQMKSGKLTQE